MRKSIFLLLFCTVFVNLNAQWQSQSDNIFYNGGKVGIGTANPTELLQIGQDNVWNFNKLRIPGVYNFEQILLGQYGSGACGLEFVNHGSLYRSSGVRLYSDVDQMHGLQIQTAPYSDSYGELSYTTRLFIANHGNIGIGTANPTELLQIGQDNKWNSNKLRIPGIYNFEQVLLGQYGNGACGLEFINHADVDKSRGVRLYTNVDVMPGLHIQTAAPSNSYGELDYVTSLFVSHYGAVGVGTTTPYYRLDVKGTIRGHEVVVNINEGADFVFEESYNLRTLDEVEQFINENKHLPDIATAATMEQSGVNMGELQIQLLQKIEELTLYIIDQQKQLDQQKQSYDTQLDLLTKEIEILKAKK